ncbi:MAG: N-6 DNA methylase [Sandaracinaceae bacterium]|nr:N-6 DNA methylase [Sandaracinaceae bacterium]
MFVGPFERWVADNDDERFELVVANPPYGERGPAKTEDPDRSYRLPVDNAYAYFLRRTQDLLAPQGLGVLADPPAFMTGTAGASSSARRVLRRHHLAAASYRLPSGLFAGATGDRNRGETSKSPSQHGHRVLPAGRGGQLGGRSRGSFIVDGDYYEQFPEHVLGEEHGGKYGKADRTQTEVAYQVVGAFEGLPALVERPVCTACVVVEPAPCKRRPPPGRLRGAGAHRDPLALQRGEPRPSCACVPRRRRAR